MDHAQLATPEGNPTTLPAEFAFNQIPTNKFVQEWWARYDRQRLARDIYVAPDGRLDPAWNVNGAANAIAGIVNERGNVLGMMPHPENHVEAALGPTDGRGLFAGLADHFKRAA